MSSNMQPLYDASRGGHAPAAFREAFCQLVEENPRELIQGKPRGLEEAFRLCGVLWNCTDIMPSDVCNILDVPPGSTYAKGVRGLKKYLSREVVGRKSS